MARKQYIICNDNSAHVGTGGKIIDIIWMDSSQGGIWTLAMNTYRSLGYNKPGHMPVVSGSNMDYGKNWYLANGYK